MTRWTTIVALAAALLAAAAAARADAADDAADAADLRAIEACVADHARRPRDCLGAVSEPCTAASGQTTLDITRCAGRETAAWDALLNRWYKALRAGLDPAAARSLRDAQRAWIKFRDADCAFAYELWAGGSMRTVAGAFCQRDRTATRAIELHEYQ